MGAVGRCAAVTTHAHDGGTAGEHALNAEAGPGSDAVAEFFEERIPAVIDGEKQLCGTWNIHAAEYKTGLMACKPSESRSDDARPVRALMFKLEPESSCRRQSGGLRTGLVARTKFVYGGGQSTIADFE